MMNTRTITKKVSELVETKERTPLPLAVIPNHMGINLCSVDSLSWVEQDDGQLVSFTIHFIPDNEPKAADGADDAGERKLPMGPNWLKHATKGKG